MTTPQEAPLRRADRVALFGAVLAQIGVLALPFALFRPNRIVTGLAHGLASSGTAGLLLPAAAVLALAASFAPAPRRASAVAAGAAAMLAALPWALGAAATRLSEGAPPFARVSVGPGAWTYLMGALVVAFAGREGSAPRGVRWAALAAVTASAIGAAVFGGLAGISLAKEYAVQAPRLWQHAGSHAAVTLAGVLAALAIGVPLGVLAARWRPVRAVALAVVGVVQTVPSLALLGLLVIPLAAIGLPGIGPTPAVIALTLYALLPIVRNTYVGIAEVDPAVVDAGRGMGMSRGQLLLRVEAPLALPLVLEGVRLAVVLDVGIAAVMVFAGAQTLGVPVFEGLGQRADDLVLLGALPMVAMALLADAGMRLLGRTLVSPGVRGGAGR